jgi:hypothetical protein
MMKKIFGISIVGFFTALMFASNAAFAVDCGEPPQQAPKIPSGETASAADIRIARVAVVAYSDKIDKYITCMDERAARITPYLNKEQKTRWEEDLANLHDVRREVQNQMNLAIRAYRKTSR